MAANKKDVMVLMNRVRKALDQPELDYVNNDADMLSAVLAYGLRFKYLSVAEWMNSPVSYRIGGNDDGTVLVVTNGPLTMEWMRARAVCFAVLRKLGLSLSEQEDK